MRRNNHYPPPTPIEAGKIEQKHTASSENDSDTKKQEAKYFPASVKIIPSYDIKIQAEHNSNKSNTKSSPDYVAIFTGLLVLVGLMQLIVFSLQARRLRQSIGETRKTTRATQDAADAAMISAESLKTAERAYLFVDSMKWQNWKSNFTLSTFNDFKTVVSIDIINAGRTPAILIDVTASVNIKGIDYPTKEDVRRKTRIDFPSGIIIKSGEFEQVTSSGTISPSEITEDDFKKSTIICYGFIRYNDIFGDEHETGFCYKFVPTQSHERFRISLDTELNYY